MESRERLFRSMKEMVSYEEEVFLQLVDGFHVCGGENLQTNVHYREGERMDNIQRVT